MFGIGFEEAGVTEAKFKVGDRVRVVKDNYGIVPIGHVDKIIAVDLEDNVYPYEGEDYYYEADEIELAPTEPKFKMGDRVRVIDGDYGDKVFQITDVDDDMGLTYYWVLPHGYCFQEARLELAPDCAERKVEQDNAPAPAPKPQPKFKAGDVVVSSGADGDAGPGKVLEYNGDGSYQVKFDTWYGVCREPEKCLSLAQPTLTPHIVALVKNGKPLPSRYPHVHDNVEDATAEAERLARNNPGQEFAVYQRVAGRVAEVHVNMKEVA